MKKGFTLIELLIVIAIIAIIAGAVLVALNPTKRIGQANDARRWSEINSIATSISQFVIDNAGVLPPCEGLTRDYTNNADTNDWQLPQPTTNEYWLCSGGAAGCDTGSGGTNCDLSILANNGYLSTNPKDPTATTTYVNDGYYISRLTNGSICIRAPKGQEPHPGNIKVCR